jgi:hypothetical protein
MKQPDLQADIAESLVAMAVAVALAAGWCPIVNSGGERKVLMWSPQLNRADLLEGGPMIEREKLEREVHQLRQIIRYALASKSTPIADRTRLKSK